jgi:hypothetical protein
MNKVSSNEFGVLILSYDGLSDLWPVTLSYFFDNLYYDEYSYPVYFGSNEVPADDPRVISVLSGKDKDWSSSYLNILEQIPCNKLLVILEDLIVISPVQTSKFEELVQFGIEFNAKHIQYWPTLSNNLKSKNNLFFEIPNKMPYRSTVCGFWDKSYLMELLIPGENPWNFEIMGSYRASYDSDFYVIKDPLCQFVNLIEKGSWTSESLVWARQNNVQLNFSSRPITNNTNILISKMKQYYFNFVVRIPWKYRIKLMNILRKAFISY